MRFTVAVFVLLLCFSSCDDDSNSVSGLSDNISIEVTGLPNILEALSKLSVDIKSPTGNTITSTAFIDGVEVANSNERSFSFSVDPFEYSNGQKTLTIVATDSSGEKNESSFTFELKKLLITVTEPFGNATFMALHKLNGELIEYKKIVEKDFNSFYAEDGFERQNFTVTTYFLNGFDNRTYIQSYSNIEPGTFTLTREEREQELNNNYFFANTDRTTLSISSEGDHLIGGYNGIVQAGNGNLVFGPLLDGEHEFLYSVDESEDFFLFSVFNNSPTFKNKYVRINDISKINYAEQDFLPITEHEKISITPNLFNSFNYSVDGFKTMDDYKINKYHRINSDSGTAVTNHEVRIPILEDVFSIFQIKLSISTFPTADAYVTISRRYDGGDINIPLIKMTKNENTLTFEGVGEYDYSSLTYQSTLENTGDFSSFRWLFYQPYDSQVDIPFATMETPIEILEAMNTNTLQDISNNKYLSCTLNDYEEDVVFKNLVFSPGYSNMEKGNRDQYSFYDLLN